MANLLEISFQLMTSFIQIIYILLVFKSIFNKKGLIRATWKRSFAYCFTLLIIELWALNFIPFGIRSVATLVCSVILLSYFCRVNVFVSLTTNLLSAAIFIAVELSVTALYYLNSNSSFIQVLQSENTPKYVYVLCLALEGLIILIIHKINLNFEKIKIFNHQESVISYFALQICMFILVSLSINSAINAQQSLLKYYIMYFLVCIIITVVGYYDHMEKVRAEAESLSYIKKNSMLQQMKLKLEQEIESRKEYEAKIHHLAYYDSLTHLPNRTYMLEILESHIKKCRGTNQISVLFLIDIDNFKSINDYAGHYLGDSFLRQAAQNLCELVKDKYIVGRHGGDEFMIINCKPITIDEAKSTAQQIIELFRRTWSVCGTELFATASLGAVILPTDANSMQMSLKNVDMALYYAKGSSKNTYSFYEASMYKKVLEETSIENSLRVAINSKELMVFYQPQVHVKTGEVVGFEALSRWIDRNGKFIPPNVFIPIAEKTGLIVPLGKHVLRTACMQNKIWQLQGFGFFKVSVNVSMVELKQGDFVETVRDILDETGLDAKYLDIEITESVIMQDYQNNVSTLKRLRDLGVSISLDDFGTGYSSLSYLSKLPINTVKIDKSFIDGILENSRRKLIVDAIIDLSNKLGLTTTAEGVENKEQMDYLLQLNCDYIQGYYFSKPIDYQSAEKFLVRT